MSHSTTDPYGTGTDQTGGQGTADTAKQQAGQVRDTAAQAGGQVAGTARDQAQNVAQEAVGQGKELVGQAGDQLSSQASSAQQTLAKTVRSYADELSSMASGSEGSSVVTDLARRAADSSGTVADWLEHREPRDILGEVQSFARRRPGAFLGIAAVTGVLVGRLTRNLAADHTAQAARGNGPQTTGTGNRAPDAYASLATSDTSGYDTSGDDTSGYDTSEYDVATPSFDPAGDGSSEGSSPQRSGGGLGYDAPGYEEPGYAASYDPIPTEDRR